MVPDFHAFHGFSRIQFRQIGMPVLHMDPFSVINFSIREEQADNRMPIVCVYFCCA